MPDEDATRDIESLLLDLTRPDSDDDSYLGYQGRAASQLAALIADQQRRIEALEAAVAELTAAREP